MIRLELKLGGLLLIQLILAATLYLFFSVDQASTGPVSLISAHPKEINKIVIDSGEEKISIVKSGEAWKLDGEKDIAADRSKVESVLNKLAGVKTRWPVTTTESSHNRFEVAGDKFQKKITLFNGDLKKDEIILGTSPGFKQVHLRRDGQSEVFSVSLNSYDFPTNVDNWLDKTLLSAKNIRLIKNDSFSISKTEEKWQWGDKIREEVKLNTEKANSLENALAALSVQGLAEQSPDFSANDVVKIDVQGDQHWQYQFLKIENDYFVKRSDQNVTFKLSQFEYDKIAQYSFDTLKQVENQETIADTSDTLNENSKEERNGGDDSTGS